MISQTLSSIITNLSNAYDMALSMGATIPASRNMENLASTIGTIQAGGDDNLPAFIMNEMTSINDTAGDIKYVGSFAFYSKSKISSVYLPSCLEVKDEGFNTALIQDISLPNCEYIGSRGFFSAVFTNLSLPKCKILSDYAFYGNTSSPQTLSLPECIEIGNYAFGSYLLSSFYFPKVIYAGSNAFYFNRCKNLYFPNLLNFTYQTFLSAKLQTIDAPLLFGVGQSGFQNCTSLASVNTPYVSAIGNSAFYGCTSLTELYLPALVTVNALTFRNCTNLSSIVCQGQYLNSAAFNYCANLESVYILHKGYYNSGQSKWLGLASLSTTAFQGCTKLTNGTGKIYVPSEVVDAYKSSTNWVAFSNIIEALPTSFSSKYIYGQEFANSLITEIPNDKLDVEYVLGLAFAGQNAVNKISEISLSKCKFVGVNAFAYNGAWTKSVNLPECEVMNDAFNGCTSITYMSLPKCKYFVLNSCNSPLDTLYLPNAISVRFYSCSKISSLDLPKTVYGTFPVCSNLQSISIPEMIKLNQYAFSACSKLEKLSCPKVIDIGDSAFQYCSKLSQLVIGTETDFICHLSSNTFIQSPFVNSTYLGYYASIYVPDSLVSAYQTAQYWSSLSARITGISNLPSV